MIASATRAGAYSVARAGRGFYSFVMAEGKVIAAASHAFRAEAARVFDAWLDPASVRRWMARSLRQIGLAGDARAVEIDARVGGRFQFSDQRGDVLARHWGTYLVLERPRLITFTWITDANQEADPSKVTISIDPRGAGSAAMITHEIDAGWADFVPRIEASWTRMLAAIDAECAS